MIRSRYLSLVVLVVGMLSACGKSAPPRQVNVYNWADYIGASTNSEFSTKTGITVNYSLFATNEELFAKLVSAPGSYDVVVPSDYMVKNLVEKGLLEPIDWRLVPNASNLGPQFRAGHLPFDPEGRYAAPYHFGTCGIGYDASRVNPPPQGFKDLLRPEFKGRVAVLDDMRYTMGAALKSLGYSANTTDGAQLDAALALLNDLKGNLREFNSTTYHEMLANGELDIVFGYSAGVLQMVSKNQNVKYVIPQEGAMLWLDSMVIPKGAKNVTEAHEYLNFILDDQQGAAITATIKTATPNEAARRRLSAELLANRAVFPTEGDLQKSEFVGNLGASIVEYERRWTELKR